MTIVIRQFILANGTHVNEPLIATGKRAIADSANMHEANGRHPRNSIRQQIAPFLPRPNTGIKQDKGWSGARPSGISELFSVNTVRIAEQLFVQIGIWAKALLYAARRNDDPVSDRVASQFAPNGVLARTRSSSAEQSVVLRQNVLAAALYP